MAKASRAERLADIFGGADPFRLVMGVMLFQADLRYWRVS